ncbi:SusC/RagA family TonB-linked outer membrane protein [Neptunitalea chrysea]|uniref:SusC/RagA family TonB-linked outer membrane protein n=1 Tax=Neptunitalea chrysea TaxID=1647581 RepID=A0A9W6B675_9FLAO|nr:TonB-dependent receptor [Neptunitalea chrysea]GLB51448.1 SusC/RagA family TonB-linked outer membrane protein [Neptunitalea chrysea]
MNTLQKYMLFLLFCIPITFWAQTTVSGVVTENATGMPIPGANVVIKGTSTGTTTDFDGKYQITASENDVIEFSYIGFVTQSITFSGNTTINISLVEDTQQLDEVVVIGYGTVKKKDATGTVDQISTEDFNQGPVVTAGQLVTGKIAGVNVTSSGGAPGASQTIRIRGVGSLSLTSNPLFVVDGVPIADGTSGGSRNPLDFINPNDIETMTVLKDASATAIYGSRAANGVIMITTKKGKGDLKFNFTTSMNISDPYKKIDVMSADQFRALINEVGNTSQIALLGDANTDWQDEIYRTAVSNNSSFTVSGTYKDFMPFRASIGYSDQSGILDRDNFKRTTASLNLRPRFLDNSLRLDLNARGMYTENTFANNGAIGAAVDFDPTQSVYDENSPYSGYYSWLNSDGYQNSLAPTNPVALINLQDDTSEVRRFIGNAKIDYDLPFLTDLTATLNLAYDYSNSNGRVITSELMPNSSANDDYNGAYTNYSNETINKLFDFYVTYNKEIGKQSISAMLGHSYQSFTYFKYGYNSETEEQGNIEGAYTDDPSKNVLMSFFGRANYNYNDKYLATATLRADASSKLNPDDRWGYFPSFSLAWNLNNEDFLKDSKTINQLKLRVGYGEVGNVNGLNDYLFLTKYNVSQSGAYYQIGSGNYMATYRPQEINEDLKWEVGKTLNIGIDYGFFDNRVSGSINAYVKKTSDLISNIPVDPFTNFGDSIDANVGDMENKGVELEINYLAVQTENFEWNIGYNIAYNDNEITNLPASFPTGGINGGTGNKIQYQEEGYSPFAFYVYQQVYNQDGKPIEGAYVDRNHDGQLNDSDKYLYKDPFADVTMGLNTSIKYKNFDLAIVTRASLGNYVYNNNASSRAYLNRATANSILSNLTTDYYDHAFVESSEGNLMSDYFVKNASFFKVDNISLGYTFTKFVKDSSLKLYGSVQNVATITEYDGLDPEVYGGIDNGLYPRPRIYMLGLNLNF